MKDLASFLFWRKDFSDDLQPFALPEAFALRIFLFVQRSRY